MPKSTNKEKLLEKVNEIVDAITGLLVVYGPTELEMIEEDLKHYFKDLYKMYKSEIEQILYALVSIQQIQKEDDMYSVIPFNIIDATDKAFEDCDDDVYIGDKEFTGKEILDFGSSKNMIQGKIFKELKKFIEEEIKDEKKIRDIENTLVHLPYLAVNSEEALMIVKDKAKKKIDEDKFLNLYFDYSNNVPRYFYGGYSFKEHNDLILDELEKSGKIKKDNLIKTYPDKKDYPKFTYKDLIELGNKIKKCEIYKIIDSDRVLELTINSKKVYVSILGFYGKDIGIIIYPSLQDLEYTYHFLLADPENYPDSVFRLNCIEVCVEDPGGFASDKVLGELKKNHYPEVPSFIRVKSNYENRLVNDEEIQIVGGVLSDLLTYIKNTDLSDIKIHLGEKEEIDYDINQLYITDNEVIYGGYNHFRLGQACLNFLPKPIDKVKVNRLKKFNKVDISIALYVYPTIINNNELPYMLILRNEETGMIVDIALKGINEMPNILNDVLDLMYKHEICPKTIGVNNDYAYDVFIEFMDYFKEYGLTDNEELNTIYNEFFNYEQAHSEDTESEGNFS